MGTTPPRVSKGTILISGRVHYRQTDRKLDVVAKVSDKRKAKVRTTSTSKIIIVNPTV